FHNAFNDAMALYTIHKAVFTTDFRSRPEFAALIEERLERIRQVKAAQEEKRREIAFSIELSPEEKSFFESLDDKRKSRFVYLRYKIVLAMEKYPDSDELAYAVFDNPRKIKILSREKIGCKKYAAPVEVKYFAKKDFRKLLMDVV
ncbi:MAG: hypothetical protein IKK91_11005, partial [Ruminococcus sp.]|nr:hypothetical protein [Ruminococcus sp.]